MGFKCDPCSGAGMGLDGDLLVEIIPGEEDCVGLGHADEPGARGIRADGVVVLEPTECQPRRCLSRGGVPFESQHTEPPSMAR